MAYSTVANIESEFKDIDFSASTTITDTEVGVFIDEADAFIDASIDNRYEVPVTGAASLLILKTISIWLVKARILSILSVKTPQDKTKQDPDGPTLRKDALKMLEMISKGQLTLIDATLVDTEGGMVSHLMNETIQKQFKTNQDQW